MKSKGSMLHKDPNSNPVFEHYYSKYSDRVEREALGLAQGDYDFADDLASEGMKFLLELSRSCGTIDPYAYQNALCSMLKFRRSWLKGGIITPLRASYSKK